MRSRVIAAGAAAFAIIISGAAAQVRISGDKIGFPQHFMQGTLYTTVDRADNKQFRELFVSPPGAIEAARKGEPLPAGTVLTLVQYRAQLDAQGSPVKGADGRFVKGELAAYTVMESAPAGAPTCRRTSATATGSTRPSRPTVSRIRTPT